MTSKRFRSKGRKHPLELKEHSVKRVSEFLVESLSSAAFFVHLSRDPGFHGFLIFEKIACTGMPWILQSCPFLPLRFSGLS
jgi:hypothetical protein